MTSSSGASSTGGGARINCRGNEYLIHRELSITSHKPIRSLPVNIIQMMLFLGNVVLACCYEYLIVVDSETWATGFKSPYSVLSYYHVCMWLLLLLLHQILRTLHRASLAEGYFTFYRKTKAIRGGPFLIASCVNAFLLVLFMLLKDVTNDSDSDNNSKQYPVHIVVGVTVLELIAAYVVIIKYILMVWHFNKCRVVPDFMLETDNFVSPRQESQAVLEIGFRDVDKAAEIIERQNDIIVHLKSKMKDLVQHRQGTAGSRLSIHSQAASSLMRTDTVGSEAERKFSDQPPDVT